MLKLDQSSDSWWKKNGPGCKIVNIEESKYEGCIFDYVYVELFHSGLQVVLAVFSCYESDICSLKPFLQVVNSIIGVCLTRTFLEEDDTCK